MPAPLLHPGRDEDAARPVHLGADEAIVGQELLSGPNDSVFDGLNAALEAHVVEDDHAVRLDRGQREVQPVQLPAFRVGEDQAERAEFTGRIRS